jgi:hypothetical protein
MSEADAGSFEQDELNELRAQLRRLRASHDRLLAAAKEAFSLLGDVNNAYLLRAASAYRKLRSAIEAEELTP